MWMGPGTFPPNTNQTWNKTGTGPTYEVASDIGEVVSVTSFDNWNLYAPTALQMFGFAENPQCYIAGYYDTTNPFDNTSNPYLITNPPWFAFGGSGYNLGANPNCQ